MNRLIQLPLLTSFLTFVLVGGSLVIVDGCRRGLLQDVRPVQQIDTWDCQDLVRHLHSAGLVYQVVSTAQTGPCDQSVYLTKTEKRWADLNNAPKVRENIDAWRGTVYCEKMAKPWQRREQVQAWGDCGLQIGSFVFFGDPEMLVEIECSLARSSPARG
jgi:hypothetical protein